MVNCYSRWEVLPSAPLLHAPCMRLSPHTAPCYCGNISGTRPNPLIRAKPGQGLDYPNLPPSQSGSAFSLPPWSYLPLCRFAFDFHLGNFSSLGFYPVRIGLGNFTRLCLSIITLSLRFQGLPGVI